MEDLKSNTKMPIGSIEYTREEGQKALVIFNETQRELTNVTDSLSASLVIEVSMNAYRKGEDITYRITPAKVPGEGNFFPFTKNVQHSTISETMPKVISSFIFMFLARAGDKQSPDIIASFVNNCSKREELLRNIQIC